MTPWSQTYSGKAFPLVDTKPSDIDPHDMAFQLAHINRFCGAGGVVSVAQHSIGVAQLMPPDFELYGLLHDAHEYAMGDITTPTQKALEFYGGPQVHFALQTLKRRIDEAVYTWAGLLWPVPEYIAEMVHVADQRMLVTEKRDLLVRAPMPWGFEHIEPVPERIVPWPAEVAEDLFLAALGRYGLTARKV